MATMICEGYSNCPADGDGGARLKGQPRLSSTTRIRPGSASRNDLEVEVAGFAARPFTGQERDRQIRDALADSDLFGALSDAELDRLIEQGQVATYRTGALVFRRGDLAKDLMIVLCGRIKLSSTSPKGKEVLFDFIEPGHCFGEFALLERRTRRLDATAVKSSVVFALKSHHMLACLEEHSAVAVRTIRVLCARLGRAMEMFEDRTQLALSSRTARALLRLANEYGSHDGDVVRIDFRISQGDMAALIGATREKVNRQLCTWCRSGILAVDEGHLTIQHPAALQRVAEQR